MLKIEETKQLTEQGFWEVLATGKPPTVDLLVQWFESRSLGSRRRNDISAALKTCWTELGKRAQLQSHIPGIPPETIALVMSLRDNLMILAKQEYDADVAELQRTSGLAIDAANTQATESEQIAERARAAVSALEGRVESLSEELGRSLQINKDLQAELVQHKDARAALEQQVKQLNIDVQRLQTQNALDAEAHNKALKAEFDRSSAAQRISMQQIDDEKTRGNKLAKKNEQLEDQIKASDEKAKARERELTQQNLDIGLQLGQAQGLVKGQELQIAQLLDQIKGKDAQIAESGAELAVLRGNVETMKEKLSSLAGITTKELNITTAEAFLAGRADILSRVTDKVAQEAIQKVLADDKKRRYATEAEAKYLQSPGRDKK